jgi:quercetin dioxygenase-like cupin family protein
MKRLFLVLALLFSVSLLAQAPEPMPLAHGNTPGEPHHHLKIENEYVRVYYVEVPPHENTQLHQHDHDYLFVTLGDSDVINAVRDNPEVHLVLKDGETHFTRGGFAHVARNLADTPFRNVTIELLKPQGEARNLCGQIVSNAASGPCEKGAINRYFSIFAEPQLETAELKLDLVHHDPKTESTVTGRAGSLLIVLNNSELQIKLEGKPTRILYGGEVVWLPARSRTGVSNPSEKPSSYFQLYFIDSDKGAKP